MLTKKTAKLTARLIPRAKVHVRNQARLQGLSASAFLERLILRDAEQRLREIQGDGAAAA
jgi:hypothetical protein